ncbi:hypothetical protein HR12_08920 [Microbacterium sp. SUBG005]|nr:hypothetical protein HR12_08920 [Microbacterium sp. SUBG005]
MVCQRSLISSLALRFRVLLSASLFFPDNPGVASSELFIFSYALQRAAVDLTRREVVLFCIHHRFQVVQDHRHLIQYF